MNEPDVRPTEEDYEAAREVLRRRPLLDGGQWDSKAEELLAEFHRRWGHDTFQLRFGLREPVNEGERYDAEFFRHEISEDEFRRRMEAYVNRPVDAEMLRQFFTEKQKDLERYSRFHVAVGDLFHPRRQYVDESDEANVDRLAGEMSAKWKMYKQEILAVLDFLQEARIEKGMGTASISEFTAATASELVTAIISRAQKNWKNCRDVAHRSQTRPEYTHAETAPRLFAQGLFPNLPPAQDVLTLVEAEFALARVCLRERLAHSRLVDKPTESEPAPPGVLLTVERWPDLAIGIDPNWRYWATSPPPGRGSPFRKSQAVELPLRGDRWKAVLKALAESPDPNRATCADVLRELDHLPPSASPEARIQADADELFAQMAGLRKTLNDDLKDLGRKLRKLVDGPLGRGNSAFAIEGDEVVCRFQVAHLLSDASGHLRFGDPPRS